MLCGTSSSSLGRRLTCVWHVHSSRASRFADHDSSHSAHFALQAAIWSERALCKARCRETQAADRNMALVGGSGELPAVEQTEGLPNLIGEGFKETWYGKTYSFDSHNVLGFTCKDSPSCLAPPWGLSIFQSILQYHRPLFTSRAGLGSVRWRERDFCTNPSHQYVWQHPRTLLQTYKQGCRIGCSKNCS